MDTTVVAATAIGAMAGLIGGLGGPVITAGIQRSNERSRQRERAAEVLGLAGPLLTELNPASMLMPIYVAPVLQSSEQDAIGEALAKLAKLDQRVPVVRENLATLAGWWSTAKGSDLAEQLQAAIFEIRRLDGLLIENFRVHDDSPDLRDRAFEVWKDANSLASQLRAEIRGDAGPPPPSSCRHRRRSSCFQRVPSHGRAQRQRDGNGSNVGFPAEGVRAIRQGQVRCARAFGAP